MSAHGGHLINYQDVSPMRPSLNDVRAWGKGVWVDSVLYVITNCWHKHWGGPKLLHFCWHYIWMVPRRRWEVLFSEDDWQFVSCHLWSLAALPLSLRLCLCVKKEDASPISPLPVRFYCTFTDFPKRVWYIISYIIESCTDTMSLIFLEEITDDGYFASSVDLFYHHNAVTT